MKRAQIYLGDAEYEVLRTEAFKRRQSVSAVLRDLIASKLLKRNKRAAAGLDAIVGMVRDTKTDVSERHDDYLWGDAS